MALPAKMGTQRIGDKGKLNLFFALHTLLRKNEKPSTFHTNTFFYTLPFGLINYCIVIERVKKIYKVFMEKILARNLHQNFFP